MLFGRYGTFAGGIDLPDEKHETLNLAIEAYVGAEPLRVAIAPCGERPSEPLVEVGQEVAASEKIAQALSGGVSIFSPTAGTVTALTTCKVAGSDEFVASPAVEIRPNEKNPSMPSPAVCFDWRVASAAKLRDTIAAGPLTTYRRPIRPLGRWVERARSKSCRTLIANAMENQPYVTADHRLLVERGAEVLAGLAILGKAIEADNVILAADSRRTGDYQKIDSAARTFNINRIALPHKYPTGADVILVKVLMRRETPPGASTMEVGAAVIDAATCLAIYHWVACALPPTGRVVTVAGPRAPKVRNYWTPFGTRCMDLLERVEQPVIHNGPMVGLRCEDEAVVTPATDTVLALDASVPAPPGPCIRCSWCTDHCPARLNVAALNDAFELGMFKRAQKLVAPACVECGVCTYVCPARLPLTQRVKKLKRAIVNIERSMPLFVEG